MRRRRKRGAWIRRKTPSVVLHKSSHKRTCPVYSTIFFAHQKVRHFLICCDTMVNKTDSFLPLGVSSLGRTCVPRICDWFLLNDPEIRGKRGHKSIVWSSLHGGPWWCWRKHIQICISISGQVVKWCRQYMWMGLLTNLAMWDLHRWAGLKSRWCGAM